MSANKIAETSTSTGTGNFTLDGAWSQAGTFNTGNRTFNSFYGLNHYFPYMIQDQSGNWEKGIGYLSGISDLVRDTVTDNSAGTTSLIDFPAGPKLVMVPSDAGSAWPQAISSFNSIRGANLRAPSAGTVTMAANRIYLTPFLVKRPMRVNGITLEVTTLAASTDVRVGIYSVGTINPASPKLTLVVGSESLVSSTTTGVKTASNGCSLGQGYYFIAMSCNGAPVIRGETANLEDIGAFAGLPGTYHSGFQVDLAGSAAALPLSITSALSGMGAGISIRCALKGIIQ